MLTRITIVVFMLCSLAMLAGCKEEPQKRSELTKDEQVKLEQWLKGTPEQQKMDKKALESTYKKSEPKGWKPF